MSFCFCRHSEDQLDDLSCTDLEQEWGAMKKALANEFEAKAASDLCHVKDLKDAAPLYAEDLPEVTPAMKEKWREILMRCK